MRSVFQKAVMRVISSDLDRRQKPLEQALLDAHQRIDRTDSTVTVARDLQRTLGDVLGAQQRLSNRLDELSERIRACESADHESTAELDQLRFELSAAQRSLGDVSGVIERLTQAG